MRKREQGGFEVIWLGGKRDETDDYIGQKQTPFSGTSGGISSFSDKPASNHTIYSLNFLPIGGFVRMPGENGDINDENGNYDAQSFAAKTAGKRLIVLVAGVTMNFILAMVLFTIAYSLGEPTYPAVIGQVVAGSPAAAAGLRPGDTIVSANDQPVKLFYGCADDCRQCSWRLISDTQSKCHVAGKTGVTARRAVTHWYKRRSMRVLHPPDGQGAMGVAEKIVFVSSPALGSAVQGCAAYIYCDRRLYSGHCTDDRRAVKPQLAGPVGIVKITGEVAQSVPDLGWWPILSLTAILSLNLAIVNILPFPALDGGRILLDIDRILRGGKRLKPEREGIINFIGMALLLTLMVVITVSDVLHWGS